MRKSNLIVCDLTAWAACHLADRVIVLMIGRIPWAGGIRWGAPSGDLRCGIANRRCRAGLWAESTDEMQLHFLIHDLALVTS
jgi:hypothetical protein